MTLVDGLISDCGRMIHERKQAEGWFDVSTLKEPYRIEGKKTMGYEVAEQFEWELPDAIFYPAGGGVGLIGMWKAFRRNGDHGLDWRQEAEDDRGSGGRLPSRLFAPSRGCGLARILARRLDSRQPASGAETIGRFLILKRCAKAAVQRRRRDKE